MRTVKQAIIINSTREKVFEKLDDLGITGMHMTESSAMMMGSKLHLQYLTENQTGLGSKYKWTGNIVGMKMNFTVEVTKWIKDQEKVWETIGEAKMIIYSWYRMELFVSENGSQTLAELSVTYEKPKGWFAKIISFLFADFYCRWCLNNMLNDTKRVLEPRINLKTFFMKLSSSKFGLALGLAFSIGFLLCYLILLIGGKDFSLDIMNAIFHGTDFKLIMTDNGFSFGKLLVGMASLFVAGTFIGWFTVLLFNAMNSNAKAA